MKKVVRAVRSDGFDNLLRQIRLNDGKHDIAKITKAYEIAKDAHKDQLRKSGEDYIIHPIAVATILEDLGMDTDTLVAALLHDVVEDTDVTLDEIEDMFGEDTALLVDGVTKLGKIPFFSQEEQQAENIRKMLLAMAEDIRVIIIKLADRLHNMRTLDFMTPQKQRDISLETMEVYAPLAHRLGIQTIKEELEDISLLHLDPIAYAEIEARLELQEEQRNQFLENIRNKINERLQGQYENMDISGRVKSIYGIYRKKYMQGRSFDEIYDIYAVRVIVDSIVDCYHILGEIHDMFRPIPNRFKDYISVAKPNGYQSLHTTVVDENAIPFEVQIRTWEMHHTAEFGIAAHWKYKEGVSGQDSLEERISWIRQTLETQSDSLEAQDVLGSIKTDLSTDEVFVFTPKGEVITLPKGSTVIDFAYSIHSEVGNSMIGAKVDGRMVSLDTEVNTGNIVTVLTSNSPGHGPSRDWLNIVKTSSSRNKIRNWFKRERRDENIKQGKSMLEKEMRRHRIDVPEDKKEAFIIRTTKRHNFNSIDDFYAALGYGGISVDKIIPRMREAFQNENKKTEKSVEQEMREQIKRSTAQRKKKGSSSGVTVQGMEDVLVKFARCCNPLPGDDIIGYITRGYGVSIHKKDCVNVTGAMSDPEQKERWVECDWIKGASGETFKSTLDIFSNDREGLLLDVSIALNNMRVPVYSLIAREISDSKTTIQVTVGANDLGHLDYIITTLKNIPSVSSVSRAVQ